MQGSDIFLPDPNPDERGKNPDPDPELTGKLKPKLKHFKPLPLIDYNFNEMYQNKQLQNIGEAARKKDIFSGPATKKK